MKQPFGSRVVPAIYIAVAILLAILGYVQYRWSTRVAAADAQREREHLDTAAALFANEFDDIAGKASAFLQQDVQAAYKSGGRVAGVPAIIDQIYYLDAPQRGTTQAKIVSGEGLFVAVTPPDWVAQARCAKPVFDDPPALVSPLFDMETIEQDGAHGIRVMRTFQARRCIIATINIHYLKDKLFPQLLRKSFGATSYGDYDFAVVRHAPSSTPLYGPLLKADIEKPFFAASLHITPSPIKRESTLPPERKNMFIVQRYESTVIGKATLPVRFLSADGVWKLEVAHKGIPLAESFEQTRRRDLLLSLAVELLLGAAIIFLIIGVRRMHRLAEQKMEFVAAVSHELRAPVSAISMLSRNQADGLVTEAGKVRQYGELMHQQSRRLNEMVEQTLQYAGIHSNLRRPANTEIDLRRLIQEAVDARQEEFDQRGIEVELDIDSNVPVVHGDPNLLRIALDNLLSNAGKYAEGGRWIRVSASHVENGKEVLIAVEDRGPGIAPSEQADIFEPFTRGQTAIDAQIPGSGIGLSLVRSAAEAHRGTVTLLSEPGRGSKFTLHLPL